MSCQFITSVKKLIIKVWWRSCHLHPGMIVEALIEWLQTILCTYTHGG